MSAGVNRPVYLALRRILQTLLRPVAYGLKGFSVDGGERLPRRPRPLILAANHAAFIDTVYLILAVPARFVVCGAKPRLFRTPLLRALMALANILKVEDRAQFLRDTAALLGAGETLLVYPEMGRNPDGLGEFETWAADAALQSSVPILPCYLYGTTRGQTGPPRLVVGDALAPDGDAATLTRRLRAAIAALAPGEAVAA